MTSGQEPEAQSHPEGTRYLDLYDFRVQVQRLYADRNRELEEGLDPAGVLERFRAGRDLLFAGHPQSALDAEQRARFRGLPYFPYEPEARVEAILVPAPDSRQLEVGTSGEGNMPMRVAATVSFVYGDHEASLPVYWIDVYGGGLFLPFRDATAPRETYGGGRYLFDTVKGSDFQVLAREQERWIIALDFNYAYNPSCAYNYRWACPLAPPENHLPFPIAAGERTFADPGPAH